MVSIKYYNFDTQKRYDKITTNDVTSPYLYGTSLTSSTSSRPSTTTTSASSKLLKPQYSFSKESYDNGTGNSLLYDDSSSVLGTNSSGLVNSTSDNGPSSITATSTTSSTRRPNKYKSKYQGDASQSGGSKTERIISKSSKSSPNLLSEHFYSTAYDHPHPSATAIKYLNLNSSTSGGTGSGSNYNSSYLHPSTTTTTSATTHPYSHSNLNQYLTSASSTAGSTSGKNYSGSGVTGSGSSSTSYYQPHHYYNNLGNRNCQEYF